VRRRVTLLLNKRGLGNTHRKPFEQATAREGGKGEGKKTKKGGEGDEGAGRKNGVSIHAEQVVVDVNHKRGETRETDTRG